MEASNEFRRREPTLLAIFSCQRAGCYRISLRDAAMTEKSYQPSRESAECRLRRLHREAPRFDYPPSASGAQIG